MSEEFEQAIGHDRRTFIKRLVIGGAFAAPVVSSFTMSGVQAVFGAAPSSVAAGANVTPPPGPEFYAQQTQCFTVGSTGVQAELTDGTATLVLNVPAGALPLGTVVCIYKGDLAALDNEVPGTPVSAYAVVWNSPGNTSPDALSTITLQVSDPTVLAEGMPVHVFNKNTGAIESAGTVTGTPPSWTVSFVEDPAFVASTQTAITAQATVTG